MKKISKLQAMQRIAGTIALAAIIGFTMAGCGGGGSNNNEIPPPETAFSVSGSFTKDGGDEVQFSLSDTASLGRSVRAITAGSYAVSGELVDGDIIFRLSGTYDPVGRSYTASSASSLIRYSINGAFNSAGASLGSTATLLVRESAGSDDWVAFSYVIDEAAAVLIAGTESTDVVTGGVPAFARGWWSYSETYQGYRLDANVLLSEWTITQDIIETDPEGAKDFQSFSAAIVEVAQVGNVYNVIVGFPVYIADETSAVAAADEFKLAQGLTAIKLDGSPYGDPDDGYWWYVTEGGGGGFQLPKEVMEEIMGGSDGSEGSILALLFEELARPPTKEEFADAIRAFLIEKEIEAEELDGPPQPPEMPNSLVYWYNEEQNDIYWAYPMNFTGAMQWDKIMPWYTTNYLERYLIGAGVTPETWYSKSRITFSNNNTRMTVVDYYHRETGGPYGEHTEFVFSTVGEARDLTLFDSEYAITVTR